MTASLRWPCRGSPFNDGNLTILAAALPAFAPRIFDKSSSYVVARRFSRFQLLKHSTLVDHPRSCWESTLLEDSLHNMRNWWRFADWFSLVDADWVSHSHLVSRFHLTETAQRLRWARNLSALHQWHQIAQSRHEANQDQPLQSSSDSGLCFDLVGIWSISSLSKCQPFWPREILLSEILWESTLAKPLVFATLTFLLPLLGSSNPLLLFDARQHRQQSMSWESALVSQISRGIECHHPVWANNHSGTTWRPPKHRIFWINIVLLHLMRPQMLYHPYYGGVSLLCHEWKLFWQVSVHHFCFSCCQLGTPSKLYQQSFGLAGSNLRWPQKVSFNRDVVFQCVSVCVCVCVCVCFRKKNPTKFYDLPSFVNQKENVGKFHLDFAEAPNSMPLAQLLEWSDEGHRQVAPHHAQDDLSWLSINVPDKPLCAAYILQNWVWSDARIFATFCDIPASLLDLKLLLPVLPEFPFPGVPNPNCYGSVLCRPSCAPFWFHPAPDKVQILVQSALPKSNLCDVVKVDLSHLRRSLLLVLKPPHLASFDLPWSATEPRIQRALVGPLRNDVVGYPLHHLMPFSKTHLATKPQKLWPVGT